MTRSLNQFGLDSLMALELKNRIEARCGITIPLVSILTGPSVKDLSSVLLDAIENLDDVQEVFTNAVIHEA